MRIHSPSKTIAVPIALAAAGIYYLYYQEPYVYFKYTYAILPMVIILAIIYMFHAQIDYWWHEKYPIKLDERLVKFLSLKYQPYNEMTPAYKQKFNLRLSLYLEAREMQLVGTEKRGVPEELKALICAHGVRMTMDHKDLLIGDFDRIYLYNHPFQTPKNQFLHTVETELEDGVMIMALDFLMKGMEAPTRYYNLAYHAFGEAILKQNPSWHWPEVVSWEDLKQISGFPKAALLKTLGFESVDTMPVLITYYFCFPEKFHAVLPGAYILLEQIFNKDRVGR